MISYKGKRVLVTGHTGFKGRHLTRRLEALGAEIRGYSLPSDICAMRMLQRAVAHFRPDFVFHLAAQSTVPEGFKRPLSTFATNVTGTANLLETLRLNDLPCAVVITTTDKVYAPGNSPHSETSPLNGHDPYASSKVAAESVVEAYREGFFAPDHRIAVATARSGNVIGPGDWVEGRLIPNAIRALMKNEPVRIWNPEATRPWQYVDDVIDGYLRLGAALAADGKAFAEAWNFGPDESRTVRAVVERVIQAWGSGTWVHERIPLRETATLMLDASKARTRLGWQPQISFEAAIRATVEGYRHDLRSR